MKAITIKQTVVLVLCACSNAVSGASQYSSFPDTTPDVILAGQSPVHQEFGGFVASRGDVNGDGYDDFAITANRSNDCRGRVYLYFGGRDRVYQHADRIFDAESSGEQLGVSIILADLNHDNYADVITGAIGYNNWQGRVYVYFGGPDMDERADMIFDGEPGISGFFGRVMDVADIDRDGYTDLVVVALTFNEDRGRAYLYYGGDPMDTIADKVFDGENPGDLFGREMDMGADVNGDGYGDLIFGSRSWNDGRRGDAGRGRAYLYYGGPKETMDTQCNRVFTGESVGDEFGGAVCLFDIDNDKYAEIMIGARSYWRHQFNQGCMYFYWGGPEIAANPDQVIEGELVADRRWGVRFGGDNIDCGYLNNDSYADILVGAMGGGQRGEGRVYLYYGAPKESLDFICDHTFTGERGVYGWNNSLGDINGDNLDDLVVSAPYYVDKSTKMPVGRAYVYYTKPFPGSKQMKPQFVMENWEDAKPNDPLHWAAAKGDFDLVKSLLSKGANINSLCEHQGIMTALHQAVIAGHKDIVEFLLSRGAHINALDKSAFTPLHRAAEHGHTDIAMLLMDKGADINTKDCFSDTVLHYAAQKGLREVVVRLIAKEVDVNAKDAYGDTPLHMAAQEGHKQVAEFLIAKGADVKARNRCGNTPLNNAARNCYKDSVEMLLEKGAELSVHVAAFVGDIDKVKSFIKKGVGVNASDGTGSTALHYAVIGSQAEVVKFLIDHGADVNIEDIGTPLHYATEKDRRDIVELLVAAGANVNARKRFPDGDTPLHSAIKAGYRGIVTLLIAHGADVNANKRGYLTGDTPLITSVESGHKDIVELLIAKGADVNAKSAQGQTLLDIAIDQRNKDIAKLIVEKGADINATDNRGDTVLHRAAEKNQEDSVAFLIDFGADMNLRNNIDETPFDTAVRRRHRNVIKLLISKGANINATKKNGETAIFSFARYGPRIMVEFMIDNGADISVKNDNGQTPLDIAVMEGRMPIVRTLIANGAEVSSIFVAAAIGDLSKVKAFLEKGVNINAKGPRGQTVLHMAASQGYKQLIEFLLENGADINADMNLNRTAAELALNNNHNDIVKLLISKGADISPLHLAISMKDETRVRSLIESGVDVNRQTPSGTTPLNRAIGGGLTDIAELLIAHGADINSGYFWGWTPLHGAAENGYKDMVELLISKGANINPRDGDDRTPLWYAQQQGHTEIIELLRKHGAKE